MIKCVEGNLITMALRRDVDVVVHGCNCFCEMGAGIAKDIKEYFPFAYGEDCRTKIGDESKLGTVTMSQCASGVIIVNAYTQFHYGTNIVRANYRAIESCMRHINKVFGNQLRTIGMPMIGSGLAGGDWGIIFPIIVHELKDCDVTIVVLEK
jgi:O-acetyl-ADP-ribose deacetylase (regulator of RNase III)